MKTERKVQTFESAMKRLEEIVALLENGGESLDETMKLYAEGCKLSTFCSSKLDKAKELIKNVETVPETITKENKDEI